MDLTSGIQAGPMTGRAVGKGVAVMKKMILAAAAVVTLGMGVASAQGLSNSYLTNLPSAPFAYSPVNG
jgi:hypothetical protein